MLRNLEISKEKKFNILFLKIKHYQKETQNSKRKHPSKAASRNIHFPFSIEVCAQCCA
jgi:hypothetical protein